MPELPEVETSRRGITPHILNARIENVVVRERRLRWPVPVSLAKKLQGRTLHAIERRGKYLLLDFGRDSGHVIIHLGMSGSLRICDAAHPVEKHDHLDFCFNNKRILRYRDPRKFGCVLWTSKPVLQHKLLAPLGPEPLNAETENSGEPVFNGRYLYEISRKRSCSIKALIMNSHIVVGVGNIYACESLFIAAINPRRKAGSLSRQRCDNLVAAIQQVLGAAIEQGGTTLRDFTREDGLPGYFAQELQVYGRVGKPCTLCGNPVRQIQQQNRSTFYCSRCQK